MILFGPCLALQIPSQTQGPMLKLLKCKIFLVTNYDSFACSPLNLSQCAWVPVCLHNDYGSALNCIAAIKLNHTATWMENSIKFSLVHLNTRTYIDFVFAILKYFKIWLINAEIVLCRIMLKPKV